MFQKFKKFFAYTRVSTIRQGEKGVSLQEQRDAILRYAVRGGLEIAQWFEERETAAKRGRPVFNQMLTLLKLRKADGVIIHKIDRSARNLKDWADLGEIIDRGIEVQFANESLDLHSRGGRLSADIQAVVAADFIRNLKEETRKGMYGRFKQGLYPLEAPIGYIDMGKGNPKEPDPIMGPLVKRAFELYSTGKHTLETLVFEMHRQGLRNRRGGKVTKNGISVLLNNPFYMGIIHVRRTAETFAGIHQPIISKSLFDRVHLILTGKIKNNGLRHDFLFRRLLSCKYCKSTLIGETQKNHVYYRCHTRGCPTCVREEVVDENIEETLYRLELDANEKAYTLERIRRLKEEWQKEKEGGVHALDLRLSQLNERLKRLTDAFLDATIDKDLFEDHKRSILMQRKDMEEKLSELKDGTVSVPEQLAEFLELAGSAYLNYKIGFPEEKRDLLRVVTSNREVEGKIPYIRLSIPFGEAANRVKNSSGVPERDIARTWDPLIDKLVAYFKAKNTGETPDK